MVRSPRGCCRTLASAQARRATPLPDPSRCLAWLPRAHSSTLRKTHLPLCSRRWASLVVADLHGRGQTTGGMDPGGMGGGDPSFGRTGARVQEGDVGGLCRQRPTAGAVASAVEPQAAQEALSGPVPDRKSGRSEEHTSELQSRGHLVCRLLLEKKKYTHTSAIHS